MLSEKTNFEVTVHRHVVDYYGVDKRENNRLWSIRDIVVHQTESIPGVENRLKSAGVPEPSFGSGTYYWGGLVRIDILQCPKNMSLEFYGPNCLKVYAVRLLQNDEDIEFEPLDVDHQLPAGDAGLGPKSMLGDGEVSISGGTSSKKGLQQGLLRTDVQIGEVDGRI